MDKVLVQECDHYDLQTIKAFVSKVINDSKLVFDQDKTVFLKLNLLTDRKPDAFTTTHPIFTQAIIEVLQEYGCRIIVGDSPAGKLDKKDFAFKGTTIFILLSLQLLTTMVL